MSKDLEIIEESNCPVFTIYMLPRTYQGKPIDSKLENETQEEFEARRARFYGMLKNITS